MEQYSVEELAAELDRRGNGVLSKANRYRELTEEREELRVEIVDALRAGLGKSITQKYIAHVMGVQEPTLSKWATRQRRA